MTSNPQPETGDAGPDDVALISHAIRNPPPSWQTLAEDYPDLHQGLGGLDDQVADGMLGIGADDWTDEAQYEFFKNLQTDLRNFGHDLNQQARNWHDQW